MNRIRRLIQEARTFLLADLWELELTSVSFVKRQFIKFTRIIQLTYAGFRDDELPLRASGLTFVTLLSLAPLLAFLFTVFKGLGRGQEMIAQIKTSIAEMPDQVKDLVFNIIAYVENSSTVGLGGFAVIILVYSVIKLMGSIEYSFNIIWGISSHRSLIRKFTDYISTLVLVPMLIMVAGALSGFKSTEFWANQPELVHLTYGKLLLFTPMFAAWIAFSILYVFMPNTRVPVIPATFSGLVAAFIWLVWHKFYIFSQGWMLAQQDKVFGAFASVPMFMIWLYVCWMVVLFGAELAFAIQRFGTYAREHKAGRASDESRILLALSMVLEMARNMVSGSQSLSADQYAHERSVPIRLINEVLGVLTSSGLVGQLSEGNENFVLLRVPDQIKIKDIIDLIIRDGAGPRSLGVATLDDAAMLAWQSANDGMEQVLGEETFMQLVQARISFPDQHPQPAATSVSPS